VDDEYPYVTLYPALPTGDELHVLVSAPRLVTQNRVSKVDTSLARSLWIKACFALTTKKLPHLDCT
jgi:hypothetical protein